MKSNSIVLAVLVPLLLAGIGCSRDNGSVVGTFTSAIGLEEKAPQPAQLVDVVIDGSDGSPASLDTLEATIRPVLAYAAARPGTEVRLWALGLELTDTRLLASVKSTAPKRRGERARAVEATRFTDTSLPYLLQAARPIFDNPAKKQSPIAEGISRVAYSRAPAGMQRQIVIITDARQVGGPLKLDFECDRKLPTVQAFTDALQKEAMFGPDSLRNTSVHFAYVALGAIPKRGCPVTFARAQQIEALWRSACAGAGATTVEFSTSAPQLDAQPKTGGAA